MIFFEVIIIKRLISLVLALILVFAFSVSSFATITADIQADDLSSGWGTGTAVTYPTGYSTSWFYRVVYWLSQLKSDSSSILSSLGYKNSSNSNIITCLNSIMSRTAGTIGDFYYYDRQTKEFSASSDYFFSTGTNLFNIAGAVYKLQHVLADDDDLAIKNSARDITQSYQSNFLSSSGANSVKTDDISNLSSVGTSVKDTFSTGVSASVVFDAVNASDPWEWFTDVVAISLLADSSTSFSTFSLRSAPVDNVEVVTSYYEDNLNDFYSWLDLVGDTE